MTGMDARIGYPNEHLGKSKVETVKSPMYATTVGLVLSGFRALDERENRYRAAAGASHFSSKNQKKEKEKTGGDFFRRILDKTKGLLIDDLDEKEDY
jgi:cell division protein FtsA